MGGREQVVWPYGDFDFLSANFKLLAEYNKIQ